MSELEAQREREIGLLTSGDKNRVEGQLDQAKMYYDSVLAQSSNTVLRARAADGLADVLLQGAGKEVVVRVLAWLTLVAGIVSTSPRFE